MLDEPTLWSKKMKLNSDKGKKIRLLETYLQGVNLDLPVPENSDRCLLVKEGSSRVLSSNLRKHGIKDAQLYREDSISTKIWLPFRKKMLTIRKPYKTKLKRLNTKPGKTASFRKSSLNWKPTT